jgi:hypothetical protein
LSFLHLFRNYIVGNLKLEMVVVVFLVSGTLIGHDSTKSTRDSRLICQSY